MTFPETGFSALGLREELLAAIGELGYSEPSPIQQAAIPVLLSGRDLIGQAATGTGKTAAFALPALDGLDPSTGGDPSVLVLVPTRELAMQVSEAMRRYGARLAVRVVPVFGGQPIFQQVKALERGAQVIVATPGRALDLIRRGSLQLDTISTVILDEADEMLDMGFAEDLEAILDATPKQRQTVLFSATMPPRIARIAEQYLRSPETIRITRAADQASSGSIREVLYYVQRVDKPYALGRVLDLMTPRSTIVFCKTRSDVDELTATLNHRGYRAEALHGGLDQPQREKVMGRLRDGTTELLVATDVAARGLDVSTLTHVVNYDVPSSPDSYVHRIGRVGRAGREGTAITLAEPRERRSVSLIERVTQRTIDVSKVPTVAELQARQVELTTALVAGATDEADLAGFEPMLAALTTETELRTVALAALRLVHLDHAKKLDTRDIADVNFETGRKKRTADDRPARGRDRDWDRDRDRRDRDSVPDWRPDRSDRRDRDAAGGRDRDRRSGRPGFVRDRDGARPERREHHQAHVGRRPEHRDRDARQDRGGDADTGYVYVSAGRKGGIRPADLVAAIANESGLTGRQIGPIRISEHFSVVGVPSRDVDHVIGSMRNASLRGKSVRVRRFEEER